jgi:hypothetical protein
VNVTHVPRVKAIAVVRRNVKDAEVVLDLGAGIVPQPFVSKPLVHICVDAHRPYLERAKREVADDPRYVFLNARWDDVIGMLPDKCVDAVYALDFIEHLEKEDGLRMLREAERVARVQIVVYTPHGFFPQSYQPHGRDRWGMDGGFWQTHHSGWGTEDFGEGWDFVISPDFIVLDEHNQPLEEPRGALWAFRDLSPAKARRYLLMEDPSVWAHFKSSAWAHFESSAWTHLKRALEQILPSAAYGGLRGLWVALRQAAGRVRHRGRERA